LLGSGRDITAHVSVGAPERGAMELANVNRVTTMGQLTASIVANEVNPADCRNGHQRPGQRLRWLTPTTKSGGDRQAVARS